MSNVFVWIPREPVRLFRPVPAETNKCIQHDDEFVSVPIVFPEILGTAKVTEYLAQEVEIVTCPPYVNTIDEGLPPDPKRCCHSTAIFGVPVFAFAQKEIVTVSPAKVRTFSIGCINDASAEEEVCPVVTIRAKLIGSCPLI